MKFVIFYLSITHTLNIKTKIICITIDGKVKENKTKQALCKQTALCKAVNNIK